MGHQSHPLFSSKRVAASDAPIVLIVFIVTIVSIVSIVTIISIISIIMIFIASVVCSFL